MHGHMDVKYEGMDKVDRKEIRNKVTQQGKDDMEDRVNEEQKGVEINAVFTDI